MAADPALSAGAAPAEPAAAEEKKPVQILFTNVNIFDGFSDKLPKGMRVLVEVTTSRKWVKNQGA